MIHDRSNCDDDALDPDLYEFGFQSYRSTSIRNLFSNPMEKEDETALGKFDYTCWYIEGGELIEHSHYPQQADYYKHINYHIEGELLFYGYVYYWTYYLGTGYNDR